MAWKQQWVTIEGYSRSHSFVGRFFVHKNTSQYCVKGESISIQCQNSNAQPERSCLGSTVVWSLLQCHEWYKYKIMWQPISIPIHRCSLPFYDFFHRLWLDTFLDVVVSCYCFRCSCILLLSFQDIFDCDLLIQIIEVISTLFTLFHCLFIPLYLY